MRNRHPLTALRAFEAVARLKSISAAAGELNVTRPAVSKQVTQLEHSLGLSLLLRNGNTFSLTTAGEELFDGLHRAFDLVSSTVESVTARSKQDNRLRVLVCRDFASSWLAAHVGTFLVDNPGVALDVTAEKNGNFRPGEDFDFRIFYGMAGQHAGTGQIETELCRWIDMPVCTHAFARRYLDQPNKACKAPYLIDANYDIWEDWCNHVGFDAGGPRKQTTTFNETTLCLSVAASGGGLTIGDSFLTLPAIVSGELIVPFPAGLLSAQSYYLYTPATNRPSTPVRKFSLWLKDAVAAYQSNVLRTLGERNIKVVTRE